MSSKRIETRVQTVIYIVSVFSLAISLDSYETNFNVGGDLSGNNGDPPESRWRRRDNLEEEWWRGAVDADSEERHGQRMDFRLNKRSSQMQVGLV
jgi:hypothetical protein